MICEEIKSIEKLLQQVQAYIEKNDFENALKCSDEAIQIIGNQYSSPALKDSTSMKLIAAVSEEQKGNLEVAANLKRNVLNARIELMKHKFTCE